MEGLKLLI